MPNLEDEYTIYGAPNCELCTKSKFILDNIHEKYIYYNIDEYNQPRKDTFDQFKTLKLIEDNVKLIPLIFIYGKFIGGYKELNMYLNHKEELSLSSSSEQHVVKIITDF